MTDTAGPLSAEEPMDAASTVDPIVEAAWGIIANAGNGDWTKETPEWQKAAVRWREQYHRLLAARAGRDGLREALIALIDAASWYAGYVSNFGEVGGPDLKAAVKRAVAALADPAPGGETRDEREGWLATHLSEREYAYRERATLDDIALSGADAPEDRAEGLDVAALDIIRKRGMANLPHRSTCSKFGFGLGGGSRAGYPCTCGRDADQVIVDAALAARLTPDRTPTEEAE